jgi:hypothetical protein
MEIGAVTGFGVTTPDAGGVNTIGFWAGTGEGVGVGDVTAGTPPTSTHVIFASNDLAPPFQRTITGTLPATASTTAV